MYVVYLVLNLLKISNMYHLDRMMDILGIIFGPKSKTCSQIIERKQKEFTKFPPWCFFSIVCKSVTLDFSVESHKENKVLQIILAIQQFLLSPFLKWTETALIAKRGWMKVSYDAQKQGMTRLQLLRYHAKRIAVIDNGEVVRSKRSLWNKNKDRELKQNLKNNVAPHQCVVIRETIDGMYSHLSGLKIKI